MLKTVFNLILTPVGGNKTETVTKSKTDMNKFTSFIILIITIIIISCDREPVAVPDDFTASQGTYIGVVHIAYGDNDGQAIVYRFNENNAQWEEISWTWSTQWDDNGWLLPDNRLIEGKEYRYKMQIYAEGQGDEFSDYSREVTGYAFKADPVEISSVNRQNDGSLEITINWTNPNDLLEINNLQDINYDIYRTEDGNYSDFSLIKTLDEVVYNTSDINYDWSYTDTDYSLDPSKSYSYKIVTRYMYDFVDSNGSYRDYNEYSVDGEPADDEGGGTGTGGNAVVEYTTSDLGQVLTASSGVIEDIEEKIVDNTLYLGAITDADLYGKPALYKLNGSNWQNVWGTVPDVEYDIINFAVSGTDSYLAGIRDSLSVFRWDGTAWSENLTPDNLGQEGSPAAISIEVFDNELYMAIKQHPDYDLQVMKYNGSTWDTIGGDGNGIIASGSVFDTKLKNISGTLYLYYNIDDVLYIKHLEGGTWTTDLTWGQEWLNDIELVRTATQLYFSSGSASADFDGGVYRVDNLTTVTNLIPDDHETWFTMGAFDLTADSDGNLIVASMKYEYEDESQTTLVYYPHLNVYDGTEWKTISGDFTDGIPPVAVSAIGNDVYYIYGDVATVNAANDPSAIKSKKLTK